MRLAILTDRWELAALYLAAAALFPLILARGRRRWEKSKPGAVGWLVGLLFGLAFIVLTTLSLLLPSRASALGIEYDLRDEVVRASALVCGVVYVVYGLLALLPLALDWLQLRGFVSFVSARMLAATRSGFLTVISVLSVLGVAVSSCALCSVTSIMGGFGHDLKRKILGNTAHIVVDTRDPRALSDWEEPLAALRRELRPRGGAATPVVGGDAMASSSTNTAGVLMRGIDPDSINQVIRLQPNIEIGKLDYLVRPEKLCDLPTGELIGRGLGGEPYYKAPPLALPGLLSEIPQPEKKTYPGIILGRELAKSLHVMVGDELTMLSPLGDLGPTGIMPRARKFRVAAIFYSGMYEYDASHAYVLLSVGQRFFDLEGKITKIDVSIPEPEAVSTVRPGIDAAVATLNRARGAGHDPLRVRDWKEMNKNLFSALKLEKIATFVILSIAIAVASFCIICTLLLMVTEKAKEIAVLKALGASDAGIMNVFMVEGMLIGAVGTVVGVAVALATCLGLQWSGVRLDPDVYYIDRLPVNVDPHDYLMVAVAALAICTLATIYPAFTASRVRPVDGLRYE